MHHSLCRVCLLSLFGYNIPTGIAMSNGYQWKKQRKFANMHLRYFGEGQKSLENYIQVESNFMCDAFKEEQGKLIIEVYLLGHITRLEQNYCRQCTVITS